MSITLVKPAGVSIGGNALTDHNRSAVEIDVERIEQSERMANGTMRKYHVADKHSFSFDWEMIPGTALNTVDGNWGADDMANFHSNNTDAPFTLTITYTDGTTDTFTVFFDDFSKSLEKRWGDNYYNVSMSLVEV